MNNRTCLAIVLAAGHGTRMKSERPKVLHEIGGLAMIGHLVRRLKLVPGSDMALVIGPGQQDVADTVQELVPDVTVHIQAEQLGTGHAVLAAHDAIEKGYDEILVVFGDTPFVTLESVTRLRAAIGEGAAISIAGMTPADPAAYGRLVTRGEDVIAIREYRDASETEREIGLCNGGMMVMDGRQALDLLTEIGSDNDQREYYLSSVVEIAVEKGMRAVWSPVEEADMLGVNSRVDLAAAERRFQDDRRRQALADGVTLIDPHAVYFSFDTYIAADVVVEPGVVFGPGVRVETGATIRAFSCIESTVVRKGASIGPFARLRPGAVVGTGAKVGNFCEIKNAEIGPGAKVNHLSYVGDTTVGARANIGAGSITCNYDGFSKSRTVIGDDAFVGSNASLVAPVTIGEGAYVASGSVITEDVSDDALAFGRARQVEKPGRARDMRKKRAGD